MTNNRLRGVKHVSLTEKEDRLMWWIVLIVLAAIVVILAIVFLSRGKEKSTSDSDVVPHFSDEQQRNLFAQEGESVVASLLKSIIKDHDGYLLNGFVFEDEQGYTSEIDHILVCTAGVFVIETKANKGVVNGQKEDEEWYVRKNEWQEDKKLKNPLKQNQGHINHLRRLWGKGSPKMISMVIFPYADITLVSDLVYSLDTAEDFIEKQFTTPRYSLEATQRLYNQLLVLKGKYGISYEEHVKRINENYPD